MASASDRSPYGGEQARLLSSVEREQPSWIVVLHETQVDRFAEYFGKVGHKVPWQKLAKDFHDERFRFQVLDEGDYQDRDWRDDLKALLARAGSAS